MAKANLFMGSVNLAKTGKKAREVEWSHLARPILGVTLRLMKANEKDSMVFYTLIPSGIWPGMAKAYLFMVSVNLAKTRKKVGQSHLARPILGVTPRLVRAN